jgi:ATP-binding cassette subfamily C protein LapB
MLIFDEPTSSMDARSEHVFVNRFKAAGLNSTLMVITHRTSLLTLVDRVIILENGKIAGMGTTDQFMRAQSDRTVAAEIVRNAAAAQAGREAAPAVQPVSAAPVASDSAAIKLAE